MSYQVFQLMTLVGRMFGGGKDPDMPKVADFLVVRKPPAKVTAKTLEEATNAAMAMFGDLVAAANGEF